LLAQCDGIVPIIGTRSAKRLEENVGQPTTPPLRSLP
jgi:hypothetical protein